MCKLKPFGKVASRTSWSDGIIEFWSQRLLLPNGPSQNFEPMRQRTIPMSGSDSLWSMEGPVPKRARPGNRNYFIM